jgi:hypothetical protein
VLFELLHPPFSTGMERLLALQQLREGAIFRVGSAQENGASAAAAIRAGRGSAGGVDSLALWAATLRELHLGLFETLCELVDPRPHKRPAAAVVCMRCKAWHDELLLVETDAAEIQFARTMSTARLGRGKSGGSNRSTTSLSQRSNDGGEERTFMGSVMDSIGIGGRADGPLGEIELIGMTGGNAESGQSPTRGTRPGVLPIALDLEAHQKIQRIHWQQRQTQFGFFCSGIFIGFSILCIAVVTFGESLQPAPNSGDSASGAASNAGHHAWGDSASADILPRRRMVALGRWAWAWAASSGRLA